MKKITAFLIAITALTSLYSCSKKENVESFAPVQSYTAEKLNAASYKKEKLPIAEDMNCIYRYMPYNSGNDCLLLGSGTKSPQFWHANGDLSEYDAVEFPEFDIGVCYDLAAANDGTVVDFVVHADYGDLPVIDINDPPIDYDEAAYDAAATYTFMIKTFSTDGKLLTSAEVSGFHTEAEKNTLIDGVFFDGELVIVKIGGSFEMFGVDGKYRGELDTKSNDIDCIANGGDLGIICSIKYKEGEEKMLKFCKIDSSGNFSALNNSVYNFKEAIFGILPGIGDYSLFFHSRGTIYGIKADTGEIVSLFDIITAGVDINLLNGYRLMDDGNMAILATDSASYKASLKKYIPRTQEETDSLKVVTIGMTSDFWLRDEIDSWNDSGNDFIIERKLYDSDYDKRDIVADQLTQDVLSDDLPDMFYSVGLREKFCGVDLWGMDAFEDLYPFIDNDDEISRDDFVPNVLECLEKDGKLDVLCNCFTVDLGDIAKEKFVGKDKWDIDKKLSLMLDPPVPLHFDDDTKLAREHYYLYWYDWIDTDTMTCHFTDESFIKWLNFCNEPERSDIDLSEEQLMAYYESEEFKQKQEESHNFWQSAYIEDNMIVSHETFGNYISYLEIKARFNNEKLTFLDGAEIDCDSLSITKASKNKDLAWQFISSMLTDEYYKESFSDYGFPMTKSGLEIQRERDKEPRIYNERDKAVFGDDIVDYHGHVITIGNDKWIRIGSVDDKLISEVDKIIGDAKPQKKRFYPEGTLYDIGREEIDSFYHGSCTAEKCAEVLQNRVETYLSEQYG